MNYLKVKNKKIRKEIKKSEQKKLIIKLAELNNYITLPIKNNLLHHKSSLKKNSSFIRSTKRCILSNKKTIFNKKFRISRFMFLKYARLNILYGIKKNSW